MSNIIPFRALQARREPAPIMMARKGSVGEIYIYDMIGAGFFEDGVTAKQFAKDIKALGDIETLNIYINSPGGSVFEGEAIYNILARQRARKVVQIDGLAASIASVIAMAGDEIQIAENGMMMIHNAWTITLGDDEEHIKNAERLQKITSGIRRTYMGKTEIKEDDLTEMMKAETWMTADEAVEMGFADSITQPIEMAAMVKFDLTVFNHVPETLKANLAEKTSSPSMPRPADSEKTLLDRVQEAQSRLAKSQAERRLKTA